MEIEWFLKNINSGAMVKVIAPNFEVACQKAGWQKKYVLLQEKRIKENGSQ